MVGFGILDQSVYLNQFHAPRGHWGKYRPTWRLNGDSMATQWRLNGDSMATQWRLLVASKKSYFQASVEKW
jgi:hypothetical protein